jgi:ribosome biogenesis protein MAK21
LFFHQQPISHGQVTDEHLMLWLYEHCLKTAFAQLVGVLSNGMNDAIESHKRACIRATAARSRVIEYMLVNILGDPDRKIAAYVHKTLQDLLHHHPLMKRIVFEEVERLLTRSRVSDRTKYFAVLFLNQVHLRVQEEDDAALASHLISVYFSLFTKEVNAYEAAERDRGNKSHKKSKNNHQHMSWTANYSRLYSRG